MKKIGKFLFSMKFALIILAVFVLVCIAGSVIPQGDIEAVYRQAYPTMGGLILALGLDDVFHVWWFVALTLLLCLNLLGCNLLHFPGILKKMRADTPTPPANARRYDLEQEPEEFLRAMGFRKHKRFEGGEDGVRCIYAVRNRIGLWGAWLTHLGIFIIILGFALGQMFTVNYAVYGVPGTTAAVGDTGYQLRIDDFQVTLRPDNTVEQYTATLTLEDPATDESWTGQSSVNHPWDVKGLRLYQNSMGWAADAVVYKNGQPLQKQTLCAGEYLTVTDLPELMLSLRAFYPDLVTDETGMPTTASDRLNNPGYLYALYYHNELLGMNVLKQGEKITVSDYEMIFTNPRYYTLIQIKRDPFTGLAGLGGGVLLAALFVAFYLPTEELWIVEAGGTRQVCGRSRKANLLFQEKLEQHLHREDAEK